MAKKMTESQDRPGRVSTCFEESPCAEMMQKVMNEQGIGSLCEELMRSLIRGLHEDKEEPGRSEKARSCGNNDQSNNTEV
jgi:hypothetical protein